MLRMKRLLILAAATLAATASLTLPAFASSGRSLHGTVASLTPDAISVAGRGGITTTCALGTRSPSVAGIAVGDRVRALCVRRGHGKLTLAKLRKDSATPASAAHDTESVKFGGAITALSDTSISLHDGDRDLTCTIDSTSPSTADYKVGQHVKVECAGGVLVSIAPVTSADAGRWFTGAVVSVTGDGLTLQTEHGPVTCKITPASPSTASLKVGDKIGMGCRMTTMELVLIRPLGDDGTPPPSPTPPPPGGDGGHTELKARGAISVIGPHEIGVQTDGGVVGCSLGEHSPGVGDFKAGDAVQIECVDGTLTEIERLETTS